MERGDRVALSAFIAAAILGGGNVVAVSVSNGELHPLMGAAIRFVLGALVLWGIVLVRRIAVPKGRRLGGAILYGLIFFGLGFALAFYGLVDLEAGAASIVLATGPLLTLLFAVAHRQERLTLPPVLGAMAAVGGVAVMSTVTSGGELPWLSVLAVFGAAACFSEAGVIARGIMPMEPSALNAVGMSAGAVALVIAAMIVQPPYETPVLSATWVAMGYMVVFGSVVLFDLIAVVLRHWAASRVAYILVLMPITAVTLGVLLLDEKITPGLLVGAVLVMAGVYFGALRPVSRGR